MGTTPRNGGIPLSTINDYASATEAAQRTLANLAQRTAQLGTDGLPAAEYLELLRAQLHRQVDDLIDAEALRHPSALAPIVRTARYAELAHGGIFGKARNRS